MGRGRQTQALSRVPSNGVVQSHKSLDTFATRRPGRTLFRIPGFRPLIPAVTQKMFATCDRSCDECGVANVGLLFSGIWFCPVWPLERSLFHHKHPGAPFRAPFLITPQSGHRADGAAASSAARMFRTSLLGELAEDDAL